VSTLTLTPLVLDRVDREPTLDDLLMDVWEGLSVRRAVQCPVCAAEMEPVTVRGTRAAAGHCGRCGSTLS
jgi:hypothetical protein